MSDIEEAIRAGRETTGVDFKERLNWEGVRAARVEVLRDIAGLANRRGGTIIIGMHDLGGGVFEPVGLHGDDPMPDPTALATLLREHFDPPVEIAVGTVDVDGFTYGYISVPAFSLSPMIATRDVHDPVANRPKLSDGDLLVRSGALATEKVKARDLREMLDSAVTARGRAFAEQLPPRPPPPPDDPAWGEAAPGSRLLDLRPVPTPPAHRLRDVEDIVQDARVISNFGGIFMPNDIDLRNGRVVRETGRIIAQARERGTEEASAEDVLTTAEVSDRLAVRLREHPWEARDDTRGPTLDLTSIVVFAMTSVLFARRLYGRDDIQGFGLRLGIARPAGFRLTVSPTAFWSLSEAYVGTSRSDIWVTRDLTMNDVVTVDARRGVLFSVLEEVLDYFGLRLQQETFDAQMNHIANRGGLVDDDE